MTGAPSRGTPASALADFDRVYVVNLAHRDDRRREMAAQLERIGLSLERPPVQRFEAVRPADAGPFPTLGTRGCFLSHLGVLRDAARAGHRRILLLEDDVDFVPGFEARFAPVAERLRAEPWDIFYGGHRLEGAPGRPTPGALVDRIEPHVPIVTAHFVAFSGPTIARLADYLAAMLERPAGDPAGGPMHVDGAYSWYRAQHPDCVTLVSGGQLATQRPSRTDIHALKWFDRWPLVRGLAQAARRRRGAP